MEISTVSAGVPEGLDQLLALNPRSETRDAITALKGDYAARAAHEARVRAATEELEAAEAGLVAHGAPVEPSAIVDEEILQDLDLHLERMQAARRKFHEASDAKTA
jgi:hypothetical protein